MSSMALQDIPNLHSRKGHLLGKIQLLDSLHINVALMMFYYFKKYKHVRSWGSLVSIVTDYGLDY
jgi:hypothetical protein